MNFSTINKLLPILVGAMLLSGCIHSQQPTVMERGRPRSISYADLDCACARLVVELLSDPGWNDFAEQYARRVRVANVHASDLECVPLMFLSEVHSGLTTRGGRPVQVNYLTGKFKEVTGSATKLQEYLAKLQTLCPDELSKLENWRSQEHALPCIRWSAYLGRDKEKGISGIDFIVHDPRVAAHGVEKGNLQAPGLAFTVEMTQNTLDQTKYLFHARIVDFLKTNGTTGDGVVVWECQIALPE